jgi:demethylmenaquinone methyltransferase/2-methoxy-6-polyprenyl-1,4-benzoquinol methylase
LPDTDQKTIGARTAAGQDQQAASVAVRDMFTSIAPKYDLLNHVLSMNVDRYWWWRTARRFRSILQRKGSNVLDLCCGTGDMAFALYRAAGVDGARVTGVDF